MNAPDIEKSARDLLAKLTAATKEISPATRDGYQKELSRLIKRVRSTDDGIPASSEKLWVAVCKTQKKATYFRRLAAVRWGLQEWLEGGLRAHKTQALQFAIEVAQILNAHQNQCPLESSVRRKSKRSALRRLPDGWREQFWEEMKTTSFPLAFLTLAVTGCRPAELLMGVTVTATLDSLTMSITGSKVTGEKGQPLRHITYKVDSEAAILVRVLHKEIWWKALPGAGSHEQVISIGNKAGFTSAIRRVGRRLWPSRKEDITPICFRHAAASDFKDALQPDAVSAAIGHCVSATKSRYGQQQMAARSGGLKPAEVKATRGIKPTTSATPQVGLRSRRPGM